MTCIYDAWVEALRIGHNQIQVKKEPVFQQTMFDGIFMWTVMPKRQRR